MASTIREGSRVAHNGISGVVKRVASKGVAELEDGSGEGFRWMAKTSDLVAQPRKTSDDSQAASRRKL